MSYIGRGLDKISNIEHLDTITFDGSSSYSLTKNSVAFTPNSAQSILISIDGVVQSNNFTCSGSTIDFGVAVPSTSTCDFIKHFGTGVAFTPADGTVSSAQLGTGAITGQTEDTSPADDDLILVYDTSATALKKVQKSNFAGGGITDFDQWRLTTEFSGSADITSNLERNDTAGAGFIGSAMTESSGIFTFPSTGMWLITYNIGVRGNGDGTILYAGGFIKTTTDNSTYVEATGGYNSTPDGGANNYYTNCHFRHLFDVTDTSTHKVKFNASTQSNKGNISGSTSTTYTGFTFARIGDT